MCWGLAASLARGMQQTRRIQVADVFLLASEESPILEAFTGIADAAVRGNRNQTRLCADVPPAFESIE